MKVLTLVRQVPDAEARVKVSGTAVDLEGATLVIDGMDEYGVEEGLRLREAGSVTEVIALAVVARRDARAEHLVGVLALDVGHQRNARLADGGQVAAFEQGRRGTERKHGKGALLVVQNQRHGQGNPGPTATAASSPLADCTSTSTLSRPNITTKCW